MIKIEKGIPIPTRSSDLPLANMEIGDSFLCPHDQNRNGLMNGLSAWKRKSDKTIKFKVKTLKEGIRVWRVK